MLNQSDVPEALLKFFRAICTCVIDLAEKCVAPERLPCFKVLVYLDEDFYKADWSVLACASLGDLLSRVFRSTAVEKVTEA